MLTFFKRYAAATLAFGFTRAVTYNYDGKKFYYNRRTRTTELKDMLLVDSIGRVTGNTCAAIFIWPIMLGDDLTRLECAVLGKDLKEYIATGYNE